ncbi:MAG TPA: phosphoribosyl-ATP diphosphatase [Methanothermobacter sp.]|nr:phosphoribosyl-ATP pyrophosphatase [Methanothermobacter sp. MT-2]HHW04822.1 phosphoribosyl-ATP diphosphatase [Methanothermobacter sp.]HOK72167.1 phosphoribosyl-ATP diphosphatase [Methanothermobacter sp.]HOL68480.1 phosphoribosyl-ATP diphosphatase [Methanothermobacter sp.]HPQ04239.1 phosphoribosyl-ATP diphosphatase [Methanothermobacter sp.]
MKNNILEEVYKVLETRRDKPIDSYTSKLMKDNRKTGEDKILEKIGEEAAELIIASKNNERILEEAVDLIFHTFLLLVYKGIKFDEILEEFSKRRKP